MTLNVFNGGENRLLAPHLLQPNQAQQLINADINGGILKPFNDSLALDYENVSDKFYFFKDTLYQLNDNSLNFLEYNEKLYYSQNNSRPKVTDGTDTFDLGIVRPSNTLTAAKLYPDDIFGEASINNTSTNSSDEEFPKGSMLDYVMKVIDSSDSSIWTLKYFYLSIPYDYDKYVKDVKVYTNNDTLTNNKIELYRYYNGKYILLTTLDSTTGPSYIDATYDISSNTGELTDEEQKGLKGLYTYYYTYYNSKWDIESQPTLASNELKVDYTTSKLKVTGFIASTDPQVDKIRLYRLGGNNLNAMLVDTIDNSSVSSSFIYYDTKLDVDIAYNDAMRSKDYHQAPDNLKYLTEMYGVLFGSVGNRLWFSKQGYPEYWPEYYWIDFRDVITGLAASQQGLLVQTKNETYIITGTNPEVFARYLISKEQGCLDFNSIQYSSSFAIWESNDGICISTGGTIQIITMQNYGIRHFNVVSSVVRNSCYYGLTKEGKVFVIDNINGLKFYWLDIPNVKSIGHKDDNVILNINGRLYQLFGSKNKLSFIYNSPKIAEGGLNVIKRFKHIYMVYKGNIQIKILINDNVISDKTFNSDSLDLARIALPSAKQYGNHIEFEIKGTGELYELFWMPLGRENGQ